MKMEFSQHSQIQTHTHAHLSASLRQIVSIYYQFFFEFFKKALKKLSTYYWRWDSWGYRETQSFWQYVLGTVVCAMLSRSPRELGAQTRGRTCLEPWPVGDKTEMRQLCAATKPSPLSAVADLLLEA